MLISQWFGHKKWKQKKKQYMNKVLSNKHGDLSQSLKHSKKLINTKEHHHADKKTLDFFTEEWTSTACQVNIYNGNHTYL